MLKLLSILMGTVSVSVLTMGAGLSGQGNPAGGQPDLGANSPVVGPEAEGTQLDQTGNQPGNPIVGIAPEELSPALTDTPLGGAEVNPPEQQVLPMLVVPEPAATPVLVPLTPQGVTPTPQAVPVVPQAVTSTPVTPEPVIPPTPTSQVAPAASAVPQAAPVTPVTAPVAPQTATSASPAAPVMQQVPAPKRVLRDYAAKSPEEMELDRELAGSYEYALSRIKNPSSCSTRSDCMEASKRVLKNIIDSYGGRSSSSWESNSSKALSKKPNKDDVREKVRNSTWEYIKKINPDDYNKYNDTNNLEILEKYTEIEHNKQLKKYDDDLKIWVRSNTKKLIENLQKYFEEVNKKSKNPTQKYIYEAISDKTDFNNHVVINDPFKVQIKMEDPKDSKSKGKKKDKHDDPWAMIGAGIMGTILGGILAPSTPPPAQPQPRPGNNPPHGGTKPQGGSSYQKSSPYGSSPYGSSSGSTSRGAQKPSPYGSSPYGSSSGSASRGAQKPSPYGSSSGSTSRGTQKPSPYGSSSGKSTYGYQNQSYSFDGSGNSLNQAAFLQPIKYPYDSDSSSYDSGYGSSYGSSSYGSSSYSSSSSSSQKSDILGPKNYIFKEGDILIHLYGKIVDAHKQFSDHDDCYKKDIKIIDELVNHLNQKNDALRNKLIGIRNKVEDNDKESFISLDEVLALFKDDKKNWDFAKISDLASGNYPEYIKNKATVEWDATLKASGRSSKAPIFQEAKIINEADLKKSYTKKIQEEKAKAEREKQKQKQSSQKGYQQQRPQQQQKDGGGLMDKIFGLFGTK